LNEIGLPHRPANRILLAQPVMLDGKTGRKTLYLVAEFAGKLSSANFSKLYGGIFRAGFSPLRFFFAFLLSSQFLRFVTNPILSLGGHKARTIRPPPRLFRAGYEGLRRRG